MIGLVAPALRGFLTFGLGAGAAAVEPAASYLEQSLCDYLGPKLGTTPSPEALPTGGGPFPLVSYTQVDGESYGTLRGPTVAARASIQFDIWSRDMAEARILREKLRQALEGYRGMMGKTVIRSAILRRPRGGYGPAVDGSRFGFYRQISEFEIWYRQPRITR